MWADLINKDKVHRVLWCALYMAVTLLLQNTVFAHIALFGVHAMFVPAVVVAVGVFDAVGVAVAVPVCWRVTAVCAKRITAPNTAPAG